MKPARMNTGMDSKTDEKHSTWNFWTTSIRNRYVIILALFAILPVVLTSSVIGFINSRSLRANIYKPISINATQKRSQLISWANDLDNSLALQIARDQHGNMEDLLSMAPGTDSYKMIQDSQRAILNDSIKAEQRFDEIFLLNMDGDVILSSSPEREQTNYADAEFFIIGQAGVHHQNPFFEHYRDVPIYIIATPVISSQGETIGVLAALVNMKMLSSLLQSEHTLGDGGEIYLITSNGELLTPTGSNEYKLGSALSSQGIQNSLSSNSLGFGEYENYEGIPVIGAHQWVPELGASLIVEQPRDQAISSLITSRNMIIAAVLVSIILGAIAAVLIGQDLSKPIRALSSEAQKVANGNLELQLDERNKDELGSLANAFNNVATQLRNSFKLLEQRVEERTKQLRKRSEELVAAADISRSVTTILETDVLLKQIVDLIAQRFDLYYVGIFMVGEHNEWAVLRAGTGKTGDAMVKRGHRLKIGEGSMVGWAIANNQARIALEAGQDPERLATADLPETRSEAALPLRSRGQILGAMTIQSQEPGAFDTDTIRVFQTIADQVAVAIDNAYLFAELQDAFDKTQSAYRQVSHKEWIKKLQAKPAGYRRDPRGVRQIQELTSAKPEENGGDRLTLPIVTRGRQIGSIEAKKPIHLKNEENWKPEEIHFFEAIIDQLGIALESARLFEETQHHAEREHLVAEITSRMRETPDIEVVLQTAAREMRRALNLAEVEIRMGTLEQEKPTDTIEEQNQSEDADAVAQESQDG